MATQDPLVRGGERAADLAHKYLVGMGRRAHDVHTTRG
jgi:hypothetical protein